MMTKYGELQVSTLKTAMSYTHMYRMYTIRMFRLCRSLSPELAGETTAETPTRNVSGVKLSSTAYWTSKGDIHEA